MREFSKISPAVWGSERFNNLESDEARYLYLFLLTCEHQTSAGVFRLKDAYATADLRWPMERYLAARKLLVEADLVKFDLTSGYVLITRWFKHNPPMNESHLKGVARVIHKMPCEQLKQEALGALQEAHEALRVAKALAEGKMPGAPVSDLSHALKTQLGRAGLSVAQGGRS